MKLKIYIFSITVLLLILIAVSDRVWADNYTSVQGSQVKAAFIYNFIKFIDWPQEKTEDVNKPLTVGILGSSPFGNSFDKIKDTQIRGRKVVIKYFESIENIKGGEQKQNEEIQRNLKEYGQCDVLFVCGTENKFFSRILQPLEIYHVLTIGDTQGFLEAGGIINFVMEEKKVRFEINMASAKRSKLEVRSKLLRLAKRVVEEDIHSALIRSNSPIVIAQK
ncbi:MAG: YfiR family protein [Planctomycetota bacterium]